MFRPAGILTMIRRPEYYHLYDVRSRKNPAAGSARPCRAVNPIDPQKTEKIEPMVGGVRILLRGHSRGDAKSGQR